MISDPLGGIAAALGPAGNAVPADATAAASSPDAQHFAALLPPEQAGEPQAATAKTETAVRLAPPGSGSGLGDAVLGTLQRFGRTVQTLDAMGSWAQPGSAAADAPALPRGPAAAPLAAPGNPSPAPQVAHLDVQVQAVFDQTRALWSEGMEAQAKMYSAAFELGLVEASAESVNKSLKTLLTQGGG